MREETGLVAQIEGVVSLRHTHGYRFGQGDLYVVVRLRVPEGADAIQLDPRELKGARWMSREEVRALVEPDPKAPLAGRVSTTNLRVIENALDGRLIRCTAVPTSRAPAVPSMLYEAEP